MKKIALFMVLMTSFTFGLIFSMEISANNGQNFANSTEKVLKIRQHLQKNARFTKNFAENRKNEVKNTKIQDFQAKIYENPRLTIKKSAENSQFSLQIPVFETKNLPNKLFLAENTPLTLEIYPKSSTRNFFSAVRGLQKAKKHQNPANLIRKTNGYAHRWAENTRVQLPQSLEMLKNGEKTIYNAWFGAPDGSIWMISAESQPENNTEVLAAFDFAVKSAQFSKN